MQKWRPCKNKATKLFARLSSMPYCAHAMKNVMKCLHKGYFYPDISVKTPFPDIDCHILAVLPLSFHLTYFSSSS